MFLAGCGAKTAAPAPGAAAPAASGLKALNKIEKKAGSGPKLKKGDLAYLVYTGKLKNGSVFDSNDKADAHPYVARIGEGGVIPGWVEGLPGMQVGGEYRLEVPSAKGYGPEGQGEKIPPNSDLFFDIKVIEAVRAGEENFFDKTDLKVGSGPAVAKGDMVQVHYKATFCNGMRFDSTYERSRPESFKVGNEEVLKGLEYGVVGMQAGGKRRLRLPPNIAYGRGYNMIPPDQLVIFEVELLQVKKG